MTNKYEVKILIETKDGTMIPFEELGSRRKEISVELERAAKIVAEELRRKPETIMAASLTRNAV